MGVRWGGGFMVMAFWGVGWREGLCGDADLGMIGGRWGRWRVCVGLGGCIWTGGVGF